MAHSDLDQPEPGDAAPIPAPSHSRRMSHSTAGLPWHWLGIAFLVVLILAAVIYVVRGLPAAPPEPVDYTATPTKVQVQATTTPKRTPPTPMSTPEMGMATPKPESTPAEMEIKIGVEVRVIGTGAEGLSFRSGPGVNYARLKTVYDGEVFTVLEGPEDASGYRWWRLQDEEGTAGWGAHTWLELADQ